MRQCPCCEWLCPNSIEVGNIHGKDSFKSELKILVGEDIKHVYYRLRKIERKLMWIMLMLFEISIIVKKM